MIVAELVRVVPTLTMAHHGKSQELFVVARSTRNESIVHNTGERSAHRKHSIDKLKVSKSEGTTIHGETFTSDKQTLTMERTGRRGFALSNPSLWQ